MDDLLNLWAGQSAKLTSLEVDIYRIDKNPAWWDEQEHYVGHAAFKNPQLAYLDFRKVVLQTQVDPKDKTKKQLVPVKKHDQIQSTPYQTIICTGAEVWDYHYGVQPQIFIYTLDQDARRRAIEEGPLPFLFNMRANEAKQRYEMVLFSEDEKNYVVKIKPLFPEEKERFSYAWIKLDRNFLLPSRIVLIAPDGKSSQDFHLSAINANNPKGVDARMFKGVNPGKPWKVVRNPEGPAPAAPANGRTTTRKGGRLKDEG